MLPDPVSRSFELSGLVERLQKSGFRIDTRQYLVAHELLLALASHDEVVTGPEGLASHLGPIFCTSAEEQERFIAEVVQWLGPTTTPPPIPPSPDKTQARRANRRHFLLPAVLAVAAVVIALAVSGWPWQTPLTPTPPAVAPHIPSSPAEVVTAPPPIEQPPRTAWSRVALGALLITGMAFGLAWLIDRRQRQLALRRLPTHHDPERVTLMVPETPVRLVPDAAVRRAAAALSRPREGAVLDLDIEATIDQTARAAGFFSPRFSARRSAREYLALVNRRGADDHQAAVFDGFLKQLRDRGIALDNYSFHDDPRVCYSDETGQGVRLSEIVSRHHQATLLVCGEAHLAFSGAARTRARWIDSTAPLDRRVFWTPEAPYRWSSMELDLVDAGFAVIPATEEGWRALVDLEAGWRQEALYPAPYARPFPNIIGVNDRRWLDRNEPPADIVDKLLRQVTEFLGPIGFRWLCACAIYPEISWGLTLRLAGDAADYSSLPSLSRLPWFRHGFMPDWLRRLLVRRLVPEAGDHLRANLERLLEDLARTSRISANSAVRSALDIGRWIGSVKTVHVLRAAPDGSPLRDQVFLGFMARANVDPLSLKVPGPVGRLFRGRVGRFATTLESNRRTESLARQMLGRLRAWEVFHPGRLRLANSLAMGILLLMLWRPLQVPAPDPVIPVRAQTGGAAGQPVTAAAPPTPTTPAEPQPGTVTSQEGSVSRGDPTTSAPGGGPQQQIPAKQTPTDAAAARERALQARTQQGPVQQAPVLQSPAEQPAEPVAQAGAPAAVGAGDAAAPPVPGNPPSTGAVGRGAQSAPLDTVAREPGGSAAKPPDTNEQIRQLLQNYSDALESLKPDAVQAVYPSVDTRALTTAFRDYQRLDQSITINRIDLAPDGQRATVVATVTTAPVVKTGRASPVTRTVTYTLRKQGDRWLIESAK